MPTIIISAVLSAIISIAGAFGVYKYVPVSWFDNGTQQSQKFGTTITTINGSDTLSSSRTTINNNFANLNSGKAELTGANSYTGLNQFTLASTTLFSCYGTCYFGASATSTIDSTGALTLVTPLLVPSGGTGWANIQSGAILYGNGTGKLATTSAGSPGNVLTLSGGIPVWGTGTIDTTQNYTWSGTNNYTGTVLAKTLTASSTITFNNGGSALSFVFPSTQAYASSTSLCNDGNGNMTWCNGFLVADGTTYTAASAASTTVYSFTVPAGILSTTGGLSITALATSTDIGGQADSNFEIQYGTGTASTSVAYATTYSSSGGTTELHVTMYNNASASAQDFSSLIFQNTALRTKATRTSVNTGAKSFISFIASNSTSVATGFDGITIKLLQ